MPSQKYPPIPRNEEKWLSQTRQEAWKSFSNSHPVQFLKYGLNILTPVGGMDPEEIDFSGGSISVENFGQSQGLDSRIFSTLPNDRLSNLHKSFCTNFTVLKIPDNTVLKNPILIRKSMAGQTFFNHLFIDAGRNCNVQIIESLSGQGGYNSSSAEIFLGDSSSLLFGSVQNLSTHTNNFSFKSADVGRDSKLEWVSIDLGSRLTLSRLSGQLSGPGSSLFTKMMLFASGSQHFDYNVSSIHSAPDTLSDISQKAALDGQSRMVINGLVKIEQSAPRSNGYQKEDILLLSPEAEAAPIPNLEIDNNNVRCTHGTTVGEIDKNILFYLMARGLDEESSLRLAVRGFFDPLASSLPLDSLQENVRSLIEAKLMERETPLIITPKETHPTTPLINTPEALGAYGRKPQSFTSDTNIRSGERGFRSKETHARN